jgi:hypothetical protein
MGRKWKSFTLRRLAGQPRSVVIRYVVRVLFEKVEHVDADARLRVDLIGRLQVEHGRRVGLDAAILYQVARTEIAAEYARRPRAEILDRNAALRGRLQRLLDVIADRLVVREARAGPGEIEIEQEPTQRRVMIRPLDADALGRPARHGCSCVSVENELGIEM